jgi:RHS repeat-associated protein
LSSFHRWLELLFSRYLYIYENNVPVYFAGFYATGDTLRIAVESGVVKYRKNGAVVYTSTATPTYPLLADTSLSTAGSTINNVVLSGNLGSSAATVQWLVADHLGTPRMILDEWGNLAAMKRHDYLPFGEELFAPTGGRTAAQGYAGGDGIRQQFTSKERDVEIGLDYFGARCYSSIQGRFASADESLIDQRPSSPQSWNLYIYAANNPLRFTDPDGLAHWDKTGHFVGDYDGEYNADLQAVWVAKGRYWDFEMGRKRANEIYLDKLELERQRLLINWLTWKIYNDWLEERNRPRPHADTLILFGPITSASRLLGPAAELLQLGTARMNLLNAIENPALRRLVEYSYRVGARIGNGSTADAIRFEKETGVLLSRTGRIQKGKEVLSSLEKLLGSNKLNSKDAEIARQLIDDLKDALAK